MGVVVQVKCSRCKCIASLDRDDPRLLKIERTGHGLPRGLRNLHCGCACHASRPSRPELLPRLVKRTLDFGEQAPF